MEVSEIASGVVGAVGGGREELEFGCFEFGVGWFDAGSGGWFCGGRGLIDRFVFRGDVIGDRFWRVYMVVGCLWL